MYATGDVGLLNGRQIKHSQGDNWTVKVNTCRYCVKFALLCAERERESSKLKRSGDEKREERREEEERYFTASQSPLSY